MKETNDIGEFLTIKQLQQLTGESESCWRKRLQRREIVFLKFGANIRVRAVDFMRWCEQRTVRTANGPDPANPQQKIA